VHWQVTRTITIMTAPNKSVSRAYDSCVKFAVNRTTFVPSAGDRLQEKGAIVKDAARHASVAFRVPILIQCRPVPNQVSEAGRNASGGITLFGGPAYFIGHFGNSVNDPPRTDWKRNSPVRLRGVPGESLQRTGLSGRRIYFRSYDGV